MATTTWIQRFQDAIERLCGSRPEEEMCRAWIETDDERLQDWIGTRPGVLKWAQCIVIIDAARLLADEPEEGYDHEVEYV